MALTKISGSILKDPLNLGEVSIGGTLTYQDVTNVDAIGILTARSDINALGNIIGDNATNISGINSVTATTFYGAVAGSTGTFTGDLDIAGSLRHIGDTDTKIFFDTNLIHFDTDNTERLRITSAGDVVINDTTADGNVHPDTKLHIKGGITFRELTSASEGALPAITQWSSDGVGQDLAIGTRSAGGDVLFYTGNAGTDGDWRASSNAERLRIASNGDVTASHSGLAVNIFESTDNHSRFRIKSGSSSNSQLEFADQDDADAGEIRYDHVNDKMTFHVGNNTERVGIDSSGNVTKPSNAIFHAFDAPSDISPNTDIVFGQERFDVGGGYNTSNGEYTAPATGYYHFYAQVYRQNTSDDTWWGFFLDTGGGYGQISESRMENDHGGDSGRGYSTLQCSIYWYMTSGHKIKCRVTTPGNIHCNTTYSYFCGNLVG